MKKIQLSTAIAVFICASLFSNVHAQTLFTYGSTAVSKAEFLKAYNKNNTGSAATEKAYREYLELFIRYKLKVRAAQDLRIDTLPNQLQELQNFRAQIVENYMTDEASLSALIKEAFERSQRDLHVAHIFIAVPKNASAQDTMKAYQKARQVYATVLNGNDFGEAAASYSDDPFAKANHGDLGFITVFSLPYDLESIAYHTAPGHISSLYRGKGGYHIIKTIASRKALGKIKAAQILLAFPPNASQMVKADIKQRADSIYNLLLNGEDFAKMARKVSGDNLTYEIGGEMPEFGVGRYDSLFEAAAFSLEKDGDISKPVPSSFGYHIIKRLSRKPIPATADKETTESLKYAVTSDPRIEVSKKAMLKKVLMLSHFKEYPVNKEQLWSYTDSSMHGRSLKNFPTISEKTPLFSLDRKNVVVKDWITHCKTVVALQSPQSRSSNLAPVYDQYKQATAFDYYRAHAELYDKEFAYQLNEFRDGNLLFEIMQRQVWDKAAADSNALQQFYESRKEKYWWNPSADAIIFTVNNDRALQEIQRKLPENPSAWRRMADTSNGSIQSDSGRFELSQLPVMGQKEFKAGSFTDPLKNTTDNTSSFAYIVAMHPERSPRTFRDARGFVINDYQGYLEDEWIKKLKAKYPVKVDEAVLKTLWAK